MRSYLHTFSLFAYTALALLLVFSCKDDDQVNDTNPDIGPRVSVELPAFGGSYNSGEEIPLRLTIEADADILSYRVLVRDRDSEEFVFALSEFTETRLVEIDTFMNIAVSFQSIMQIEVRAEDSFGNQVDKVVSNFGLAPPVGNLLTLNFDLSYDDQLLVLNNEYEYPSGEKFEFSRFDIYISNVALIKGDDVTVIKDVDYLKMTETYSSAASAAEGYKYTIAGLEDGNYDAVRFNIGLTPEQNSTTPSEYPVSHPLGQVGDYWSSWDSYIFASIEGRMNIETSNPDFEQGLALHLGSDDAMRTINIADNISLASLQEEIIPIKIDLRDLFVGQDGEVYDIVTTPATHSLAQIPEVIELADNLKNSINK